MEKNNNFLTDLMQFVVGLSEESSAEITPDTDLIETGIVDSLSITQILMFIEEKLNISVSLEDLLLDSVRTARGIDQFYNTKK